MPAGTIALTNGSATVSGTGTAFTTEFKVGDFLGVIVGGVPYTLIVQAIASNTSLTITAPFTGPTTSGLAWSAVPATLQTAITQQAMNDMSKIIRGMIQEKANWQQVYSGTGNITVRLPDGSSFTGPAWGGITTSLNAKANSADVLTKSDNLASLGNKSQAVTNLGMGWLVNDGGGSYQIGNTGNNLKLFAAAGIEARNTGGAVGSAPTGSDPLWTSFRAGSVNANSWYSSGASGLKYGGPLSSYLVIAGAGERRATFQYYLNPGVDENVLISLATGGNTTNYLFNNAGYATASKGWITASDERIKKDIAVIDDPLGKMKQIRGCTWSRVDMEGTGIGFIAQDVQRAFPDSVIMIGNRQLPDGSVVKNVLAPDTTGVAAALHHQAILALMDKIEQQNVVIAELQKRMKAIDGLDA